MLESPRTALLWLVAGLAAGTLGGYFWGADAQPTPTTTGQESSAANVDHIDQKQTVGNETSIAAAMLNPTGLRLVGTVVQPERSKSKAWLLQVGTDTTQSYAEGDALPGGYQLISIGTEDLQVSKDGYKFSIHRASSSSGENTSAPCQALAQNTHSGITPPKAQSHSDQIKRSSGIAGKRQSATTQNSAGQNAAEHHEEKVRKTFKGWSSKTVLEGDATIDARDTSPESATDKDDASDTAP
ncbi:hypothetical protein [Stenotrophobium rhamnosiphilum]|uniref:Type II secretion system protein GspC N-terminal domain-containing protein n=1 Tax=Stenotrophobium rhamnosiphilum TaxID=2029166 RepID=A0A2T5MCQ3_9GAMM|nr:hypothetical protein [Stenotrophobium rhamnosiphilum]PTU30345.1 hypothetical protein CJD38_15480 [Stenotrophobium rhamnosiphilum]